MPSTGRLWGWTGTAWVPVKTDATGAVVIDQTLGGGGGAPAWKPSDLIGFAFATRAELRAAAQNPAFAIDATRQVARIAQSPALALAASGVGTATPAQNPALLTTVRISDFKVPETPALEMVRVVYNLTRTVGGNAQAAVGTAWTNPGNAINGTDGRANGSPYATCVGTLGGNTNGIELSYANSVSKAELVIASATLNVYMNVVDGTGLLCDTNLSYNIGGGLVALEPTIQGAFTNIVTPRSYVLPITTWTEFDALQARAVCIFAAASALANASLDAIEIVVVASKTDTL